MIAGTSVVFDSWRFIKKRRFFSIETHNFSPSVNCLNVTPSESVGSLVNASCYRMAKLRSVGILHPPRNLPTFKKVTSTDSPTMHSRGIGGRTEVLNAYNRILGSEMGSQKLAHFLLRLLDL